MSKINVLPKKVKSRSTGVKPFLENAKTAFPNVMRRVTQTAKTWAVREKHSEKLKPYLSPGANYPGFDDTYPTPFQVEMPNIPGGNWTDVEYGGEDSYRFLCNISCFQTTKESDKCTAPIKCTYGAWTVEADGNVGGWQVFDSTGKDITGSFIIKWKPSAGLNGQIWITPDPSLIGILNDDFETLTFVFHDKGNKPGSYYHPLLQRWIQLVGGKSTCKDKRRLKCVSCICPSGTFAFDDGSTPDTIAPGGAINVFVSGGCPPYSWSVAGLGFTMDNASTQGLVNVLNSPAGACGVNYGPVATVTITDNCTDSVQAVIRNTGGQWTQVNSQNCGGGTTDRTGTYVQTAILRYRMDIDDIFNLNTYNLSCPGSPGTDGCFPADPCGTLFSADSASISAIFLSSGLANVPPCCFRAISNDCRWIERGGAGCGPVLGSYYRLKRLYTDNWTC